MADDEKARHREEYVREMNERHLAMGRHLQQVGIENLKRLGMTADELRGSGVEVPAELASLLDQNQ